MQFDGGAQSGVGTGGFVIVRSNGEELVRAGRYYGPGYTNNEAEATAMLDALECLQCLRQKNPSLRLPVRLWGDS